MRGFHAERRAAVQETAESATALLRVQSAPPLRGDKEKDMKKQHRRFRWAFAPFALAAAAALAAFAAGCGSGLLDTEDKDESFYTKRVIVTSSGGLVGNYGMVGLDVRVTITVLNGNFSRELIQRIEKASDGVNEDGTEKSIDVTDYFTVTTGTSDQLLKGYRFKAITPVTNSHPDVGSAVSRGSGSFTAVLSYTVCDSKKLRQSVSTGSVQITASADALDETSPLECTGDSISYRFSSQSHELLTPSGSALYWAQDTVKAKKITTRNAATLLTTSYPIQRTLAKGDKIGETDTGAVVLAANTVQEGAGKIFAVVYDQSNERGYTGSMTIRLDEGILDERETSRDFTTKDAATTLLVPLYGLDFDETGGVASTVATGPWLMPTLFADAGGGFALCETPKANNATGYRGAFTVNPNAPTSDPFWGITYADSYVVEFDLMLDGLAYETSYSYFYLYNGDVTYRSGFSGNSSTNQSEELTANPPNSKIQATSWVWRLTGEATWLTSGTMQHYKVYVNYDETAAASTVTVEVDGKVVETNTAVSGNGGVQGVLLEPARGTAQTIDNIRIYYASK